MDNEKDIVDKLRKGEPECFPQLLDRYGSMVFSLILRVVSNREDAEEITQDAFLKVLESIDRYKGSCALQTWIYRIAYNTAISHTRRKRRETPTDDQTIQRKDGMWETGGETEEKEEVLIRLENELKKLSVDDQLIINMFYYQDKSIEELSQITGLSQSNVKVRLHRIRKKLQEEISR